ncbi:MAG: carbohydrate ABC transporter permease [Firmicutes bacterium]|nr:carbohydrate ABC transporter permease [Bacillota bacterium]
MRKLTRGEQIFNIFNVLFLFLMIVISIYPMLYVFFAAFSTPSAYMRQGGNKLLFCPVGFSLASFKAVFKNPSIWTGYGSTIFILAVGVPINIVFTMIGAYVLSRKQLRIRRFLSLLILFTMYFSGGMIPIYLNVRNFGLDGSLWALIIPNAINTFNLIIMRTAFEEVPDSLEEAAKLDGASQLTILFKIMVPLVVPTIAVLILYYAVYHWNSWFNAMLFIHKREKYPLQLILRELIIQNSSIFSSELSTSGAEDEMISETIKYATIVVATVPILAAYPFLQKYFVKGIMVGAVKG